MKEKELKEFWIDLFYAILAGVIVGSAYFFFQNSNGFAPGGVGGLATITYHFLDSKVNWTILMIAFNFPIYILVSILINKKLGFMLRVYMLVQSVVPLLYSFLGALPYSAENNADDFNIVFACIATGVISGLGFALMLRRFGAGCGAYGIAAMIKQVRPETNIAHISFIMDAGVVLIAFFLYGMRVTPAICTLLNLFIANIIVDSGLSGLKNGYKFEIVTTHPEEIANEVMEKLKHGVTKISVHGMYSDSEKYMLVCVINKRQIGQMMKIIKSYPDTFATFGKINEVFGNFRRKG